jgi:hypothetical protein
MLNYLETATAKELFEDVVGAVLLFSIPFLFPYAVAILKAIL